MNQIKNNFLRKKSEQSKNRVVGLKHPEQVKSVLLVSNKEGKSVKRKIEELFPNASVYHLFHREIKEDRTVGFYYSVHPSDFNLTGKLKNDKLVNLEGMDTELLIDLSVDSDLLDYFVFRSKSALKVGNIQSKKADAYDLLVEFGTTESQNVENIYKHLNTLTQDANIPV